MHSNGDATVRKLQFSPDRLPGPWDCSGPGAEGEGSAFSRVEKGEDLPLEGSPRHGRLSWVPRGGERPFGQPEPASELAWFRLRRTSGLTDRHFCDITWRAEARQKTKQPFLTKWFNLMSDYAQSLQFLPQNVFWTILKM